MGEREDWIEALRNTYPLDASLFGTMGAFAARFLADASTNLLTDKRFDFMDLSEFEQITEASRKCQVYWKELLFRVYWAAQLNLMRHQRWQAGCVAAIKAPANLLSFAANLRGLLEASLDAYYSLGAVPCTLAESRAMIECNLKGSSQPLLVIPEMEDRLIHFVYGRKIKKGDSTVMPSSHSALEPKDYRNAAGLPEKERISFAELYDELCGICHPTAFSLSFLWNQTMQGKTAMVEITRGDDDPRIRKLCQKFDNVIGFAMSLSVTSSGLCLKALNWFSLPEVRCPWIERWNFDDVPLWRKAQALLSSGTVGGWRHHQGGLA